jgi:hypothetical protein
VALAIWCWVIEDEAGALAAQVGRKLVELSKALAFLVAGFALHVDDNAAVGEGFGQAANGGDGFWAPGRKS